MSFLGQAGGNAMMTCVSGLAGGEEYRFGGSAYFTTPGDEGRVWFSLWFAPDENCFNGYTGTASTGVLTPEDYKVWSGTESSVIAPEETGSAYFVAWVFNDTEGSSFETFLDNLFVRQTTDVFEDGFERGSSCRWSFELP